MWLLEVDSVESYPRLKNVPEQDLEPPEGNEEASPKVSYAILSHRWENDGEEMIFGDIGAGASLHEKKGWYKTQQSCRQARSDGYQYVWIDTCCIDKRSSAELQEAINSMFHWYKRASVCYVYLRDVSLDNGSEELPRSEWFSRGWTLQELLAPSDILFYDNAWNFLGDKASLSDIIARVTSIDEDVLRGTRPIEECSVATRMSWASHRRTTRIEDHAYSLLGIFGINMPMLYGERDKAFMRLQEEILKRSDDNSIFAWSSLRFARGEKKVKTSGLLAVSPDDFKDSGDIIPWRGRWGSESYTMTNRGLSIYLEAAPHCTDVYLVNLDCSRDGKEKKKEKQIGIFLHLLPNQSWISYDADHPPQFERVAVGGIDLMQGGGFSRYMQHGRRKLLIPQSKVYRSYQVPSVYGFLLSPRMLPTNDRGRPLFLVKGGSWDAGKRTITIPHGTIPVAVDVVSVGFLISMERNSRFKLFAFAFDDTFRPLVFVTDTLDLSRCGKFGSHELSSLQRQMWDEIDWTTFAGLLWSGLRREINHFSAPTDSGMWVVPADQNEGTGSRGSYLSDNRVDRRYAGRVFIFRDTIELDGHTLGCWNIDVER